MHAHAAGPSSVLELFIVGVAAVALVVSVLLAIRYTLRPGETSADHIKRRMIEDEDAPLP